MDDKNIDDVINDRCSLVMECANYVLLYKDMLKKKDLDVEMANVLPSYIEEYVSVIDEFTHGSSEYILTWVRQMNESKVKLDVEKDKNKQQILQNCINQSIKSIKEMIIIPIKDNVEKSSDKNSKATSFRESLNINPINQVLEISKMCEEHQKELRNKGSER